MSEDEQRIALRALFDCIAHEYDAIRPGYPAALIEDIVSIAALPASGRILEVGCGTGQATLPFAQRGYQLTCLDIGPALAALAAQKCRTYPNVHIHVSAFEDWPAETGAFDLVMSATAFHWVAPEIGYRKAARVLKDSGALAIFSNEHPTPYTDFFLAVQPVYQRFMPDWSDPNSGPTIESKIAATAAAIDAAQLFAPVIVKTYPWTRTYTAAEYCRLLSTYSNHLDLEPHTRARLHQGIADVIEQQYGGTITKPYLAVLYIAKK